MEDYVLQLNLQEVFPPYFLPSIEEVVIKVVRTLKIENDDIMVIPLNGRGKGIYRLHCKSEEVMEKCINHSIKFTVASFGTCSVKLESKMESGLFRGQKDPLLGYNPTPRREGTLITFQYSCMGALADVSNEIFDLEIGKFGEVIKPTTYQFHKGTSIRNGNRYVVIEKGSIDLPRSLLIKDLIGVPINIHIRFKGQSYTCQRC